MTGGSVRGSVAVWIAGREYKIRSDGDDEALVRIAGYVDRAMQRVRERTGTVDSLDVAVLTCLNLAREILALHERPRAGADDQKLRSLIDRIESAFHAGVHSIEAAAYGEAAQASEASEVSTVGGETRPRMLELPSVEDLRDRLTSGGPAETLDSSPAEPRARAAAGGRERVG